MLHSVSAFVVRLMAISGCDISLGFAFFLDAGVV